MAAPSGDDLAAVAKSWKTLGKDKDAMLKYGALLFGTLFTKKPESLAQFKHFTDAGIGNDYNTFLTTNGLGKAHSMAVFKGLDAFVESAGDADTLKGLATKLARNHKQRNMDGARFQLLIDVFPAFLDAVGMADTAKGWNAFLVWLKSFF